jgi:hypothetical protein
VFRFWVIPKIWRWPFNIISCVFLPQKHNIFILSVCMRELNANFYVLSRSHDRDVSGKFPCTFYFHNAHLFNISTHTLLLFARMLSNHQRVGKIFILLNRYLSQISSIVSNLTNFSAISRNFLMLSHELFHTSKALK